MEQRQSVQMTAPLALALIFNSPAVFAAYQYSVDLLPGQVFSSQQDAEAALHALSPQASHLIRERLVSETPTQKVWLYSAPPQPLIPATPALYGAPYYLITGYLLAPPMDTVDAAIDDWWQRYQRNWAYAFPGCSYSTIYYPNGQYTNRFARATLAGTCGGAGEVTGTQVQPPKPAHCPPDYLNTGSECVIALTAYMTETWGEECPIPELTPIAEIPPNGPDILPLTLELENSRGATLALTADTESARQCLVDRASALGINVRTTSGTRTVAYQKHFIEIWDKMIAHNKLVEDNQQSNPVFVESCRQRRERVIAEKGCSINKGCVGPCLPGSHCIRYKPAVDSKHPDGTAFDISEVSIESLKTKLTESQPPTTMSQFLAGPPACKLRWGGDSFRDPDDVHFQLR